MKIRWCLWLKKLQQQQKYVPNIAGLDADNVFTMRNIPDTYAIKDFIDSRHPKKAVVVGGGFIGIELDAAHHQTARKRLRQPAADG